MALNEEKILSDKFVFISYSHKDANAVKEDVSALLARGVRLWYDEHMRLGDKWTDIAERIIYHENCIGVLFYNSPNAFTSSAVQREQQMAADRLSSGEFHVWSVHLDAKPFSQILPIAMMQISANDPVSLDSYVRTAMPLQQKMFNDEILCIMRTDSEEVVERVYNDIAVPYRVVDNEDNFMDSLQKGRTSGGKETEIVLGRYISSEYFGPERPTDAENQRFGSQRNLIQLDGKRYNTKELRWRLLYVENSKATLLCTQILDQKCFEEGRNFLQTSFPLLAFADINDAVGIVARYATENDVQRSIHAHTEDALKLATRTELVHWWIDEDGMTDYWKRTYSDGFLYKKGFSVLIKKGVRPVIEIPVRIWKSATIFPK